MTAWHVFSDRVAHVGAATIAYLPNLLLGGLIVIVGWLLAISVRWLTLKGLVLMRVDRAMSHIGYAPDPHAPLGGRVSTAVSYLAYWFVLVMTFVMGLEALGLSMTQDILTQIGAVLANVVVAVVVLIVGGVIAMVLGEMVSTFSAHAGVRYPILTAKVAKWLAMAFVLILAFRQLGVAAEFVFTIIEILVAAVGFAVALALGLGCKDIARDIVVELFRKDDEPTT